MARGGAFVEAGGKRNYYQGEYDTAVFWTLWLGVPVWLSVRDYGHFVELRSLPGDGRIERIRHFAERCLGGWKEAPGPFGGTIQVMRLRPSRVLAWTGRLEWMLWWLAVPTVAAIIMTFVAFAADRPWTNTDRLTLIWTAPFAVFFFPLLALYWKLRTPSARQVAIRTTVAQQLGPLTDPADWLPELAVSVLASFNITSQEPATILREAERFHATGNVSGALLVARLARALIDPEERPLLDRTEELTDECLSKLSPVPSRR